MQTGRHRAFTPAKVAVGVAASFLALSLAGWGGVRACAWLEQTGRGDDPRFICRHPLYPKVKAAKTAADLDRLLGPPTRRIPNQNLHTLPAEEEAQLLTALKRNGEEVQQAWLSWQASRPLPPCSSEIAGCEDDATDNALHVPERETRARAELDRLRAEGERLRKRLQVRVREERQYEFAGWHGQIMAAVHLKGTLIEVQCGHP